MNRTEFYEIVKKEKLDKYPVGDSKNVAITPYVVGCVCIDGDWCVYENDERGSTNIISKYESEEEGLKELLRILRMKKRKDELMRKIRR
ncbi:hypothetical protein J2Z53_001963 [Clostridium moniliforme]|uniref:Uncharacterized protein n=1 Tax=Clostridium moniliforme TaxID=39489 RepID=A0ABS4F297_9CLOT|nr:hypothetical protein [Clostridium moniliforme]MBP1890368.1 hypothetical protein [Clostridium moniliforme]